MLLKQLQALSEGVSYQITVLSNAAALLSDFLEDINWAGFYLTSGNELLLGPFQGKPACTNIAIGKGVCGSALATKSTQRVADVHKFPGHIACDGASNSEIVVPLMCDGECIGVLDIDSPVFDRFDEVDQYYLERFACLVVSYL
ncbi:MAG: GAF domain-containing protein [Erysipelotrichales bacterium]|nr:GAF domain-containing protein [Erysipelotrichales bacterium]